VRGAKSSADRILKRVGIIDGEGRIYNVDSATYNYGYITVNPLATTPFSRSIVHKGWFSGTSDISNGDLLQDRGDNLYYLVMSVKQEIDSGASAYIDGTLYLANRVVNIYRFSDTSKNFFGKDVSAGPSVVVENIRAMITPIALDVLEQPDQTLIKAKIKVVVQAKYGVKVQDRITTTSGGNYKVVSVDNESLEGLTVLYVDEDIR